MSEASLAEGDDGHHLPVDRTGTEVRSMFIRAVWRLKRLIDIKQSLREMEIPASRDAFGLSRPDFPNMTKGLFDR
jgi:hypothetical protein